MSRWIIVLPLVAAFVASGAAGAATDADGPVLKTPSGGAVLVTDKKNTEKETKKSKKKVKKKRGRKKNFMIGARGGPSWNLSDWPDMTPGGRLNQFKLGIGIEKPVYGVLAVFVPVDMGFYENIFTLAVLPGVRVRPIRFDAPVDLFAVAGLGAVWWRPDTKEKDDQVAFALRGGLGTELNLAKAISAPFSIGIEADYTVVPFGFDNPTQIKDLTPMYLDILILASYRLPF